MASLQPLFHLLLQGDESPPRVRRSAATRTATLHTDMDGEFMAADNGADTSENTTVNTLYVVQVPI